MTYLQLLETVSTIIETDAIYKTGLVLEYTLNETEYDKLNLDLLYKSNNKSDGYDPSDEFEVEIGGILVKIKKSVTKVD